MPGDSLYGKRRNARAAQGRWFRNFERWNELTVGIVFSVDGSIFAPHSNNQRVFVHEFASQNSQGQAIVGSALVQEGTPVKMMRYPKDPMLWQIVGVYMGGLNPTINHPIGQSQVSAHATSHQQPTEGTKGIDPVDIWPPALQMFKTTGDDATLSVVTRGMVFYEDDVEVLFGGAITDLTSHVPGANLKRAVLVYLDPAVSTTVMQTTAGTTVSDIPTITPPAPDATPDTYPSCLVYLSNGQTVVNTVNHVRDRRTFNQRQGSFTSWLELTDTDPTTYTAQAGLLVRVNAVPDGLEFVDHEALVAIHLVNNYSYADAAARTGASGFAAGDLGKVAHQTDDDTFWILIATTPTWTEITGTGSGDVSGPGAAVTDNAIVRWDGTGGTDIQNSTAIVNDDGSAEITIEDAVTAAASAALTVGHNSSGTPAIGFGTEIEFKAESSTTPDGVIGALSYIWRQSTHAIRKAGVSLSVWRTTELNEVLRIESSGTSGSVAPNARGQGAVDIQTFRVAATNIASGINSTLIGGLGNTASGNYASVLSGQDCAVTAQNASSIGGWDTVVAGQYSVALGGQQNTLSSTGRWSVIAGGIDCVVAADLCLAFGRASQATIDGSLVHASGTFSGTEVGQTVHLNLWRAIGTHADTTWFELFIDGTADRFLIGADHAYTVRVLVTGVTSGVAETWHFEMTGMVKNAGGTTTIVEATNVVIYDGDDTAYEVRLLADDTNDALLVQVRRNGGSNFSIRWHAAVTASMVEFS